jgi:hypothetical protein
LSSYRPDLREVFCHCWTEGSWIAGGLCLPSRRGLLDHLNQKEPFLKLRGAVISHKKEPLPFLALRRDRVALVVPPEHESVETATSTCTQHRVVCLLKGAILSGTLETLANMRVSDFLMRAPGFFALGSCTVRMAGTARPPFESPVPTLLVNAERVIGVAQQS